jgi:4-amino-4-deoxy-L-arabinose transferase-like glycosyltransferase
MLLHFRARAGDEARDVVQKTAPRAAEREPGLRRESEREGAPGPRSLLRRFGLLGASGDGRLGAAILATALALYGIGFAAFPPRAITNDDEGRYLEQTNAWLELGSVKVQKEDPLTGARQEIMPGDYPMGMVVLMAPFVSWLGWRGVFLPSFVSLLVAVLVTARWLRDERRSPLFALLLLGFPALLVTGRMAISDATRTAAAALGLWLFFRGLDRTRGRYWLASGLVAGAALSLRESAVLPFVPLFAGAVLRFDRGWGWLLLGGLAGTGFHFAANAAAFGDALFVRGAAGTTGFYPFEIAHLPERLQLYGLGLLVLVPAGLVFGLAYRGRRRPELVATTVLIFLFYSFQAYGAAESGFPKSLVIGLRYFAPLVPILAFTMAEALPRWLGARLARGALGPRLEVFAGAAVALWLAGVLVASFAVHPALDRWAASQAEIRAALDQHVPREAVLVANHNALGKFIDDLGRPYLTLERRDVDDAALRTLGRRHGTFFVALLDRGDSEYWLGEQVENADFATRLPGAPQPLVDVRTTATDRLRIWRVTTTELRSLD